MQQCIDELATIEPSSAPVTECLVTGLAEIRSIEGDGPGYDAGEHGLGEGEETDSATRN